MHGNLTCYSDTETQGYTDIPSTQLNAILVEQVLQMYGDESFKDLGNPSPDSLHDTGIPYTNTVHIKGLTRAEGIVFTNMAMLAMFFERKHVSDCL